MKSRLPASPFLGGYGRHGWAWAWAAFTSFVKAPRAAGCITHTHKLTHTCVFIVLFLLRGILVSAFSRSRSRSLSSSPSVAVGNLFCMLIADKHLMRFIIKLEIVRHTHGMATSTGSRGSEEQKEVPRVISKQLMASISQSALKPLCKYFPQKKEKHKANLKPVWNGKLYQQMQCTI